MCEDGITMSEEYFTITLSSSDTSFEDNTLSLFRTCLPQQISLEGKWEVVLSELHYTRSWFNLPRDEQIGIYNERGDTITSPTLVKAGYYERDELVRAVTRSIKDLLNMMKTKPVEYKLGDISVERSRRSDAETVTPPRIELDSVSRRVELIPGEIHTDAIYIDMSAEFGSMLGFGGHQTLYHRDDKNREINEITFVPQQKAIKGDHSGIDCYDLNYGIHALYVYCNLVSPQILGNTFAPLLRVVPVENIKFGGQCHQVYTKPYFYPLACNNFQVIEAEIRQKTGDPVDFKFGDTTLVLEFRRVK